jgi:hypothetical protein
VPVRNPDRLRVGERAVVAQARRLPVAPGVGLRPAQEVLASAPLVLPHAAGLGDAQQAREPLARCARRRGTCGSSCGRRPRGRDADVAHQPVHPRVLEQARADARALVAVGEEVEGAAEHVAVADVHREVERVVRVGAAVGERAEAPRRQPRLAPAHEAARELAYEVARAVGERGERVVHVVREPHRELAPPALQPRPGALQRLPQQVDVGVDDRRAEEGGAAGDRRGRRP